MRLSAKLTFPPTPANNCNGEPPHTREFFKRNPKFRTLFSPGSCRGGHRRKPSQNLTDSPLAFLQHLRSTIRNDPSSDLLLLLEVTITDSVLLLCLSRRLQSSHVAGPVHLDSRPMSPMLGQTQGAWQTRLDRVTLRIDRPSGPLNLVFLFLSFSLLFQS